MGMKIKLIIPFVILFPLLALLSYELFFAQAEVLPSVLIGEQVPHFALPTIDSEYVFFKDDMLYGRVSLVNVWASWCEACAMEQAMLMKIKAQYHVPIYGIDYKDERKAARVWLRKHGNPYVIVGSDQHGDTAIDLGVYGTPETFVIAPDGKILYRYIGVLKQKDWDEVLYPLIRQYEHAA
jgi:cytochrome c biogenesis protein CcmG/thiol:disulfide interchange protein DsbE